MARSYLATGSRPGRRASVGRFAPMFWTTDFNLATSGSIVTRGRDGLDVFATIRRNQDTSAAIWHSELAVDHVWFRPEPDGDYTGCVLEFSLEVVGDGAPLAGVLGPSLTIETENSGTFYVRLWKYRADPANDDVWSNRFRIAFNGSLRAGFDGAGDVVPVDEITRIFIPVVPRDFQGGATCELRTEIVQGGTYETVAVRIPGGRQPQAGDVLSIWPFTLATDDQAQLWIASATPAGAGYPADTFLITPAPAFEWPFANTLPIGAACQITTSSEAVPLRTPNEVTLRVREIDVSGQRSTVAVDTRRLTPTPLGMSDGWDNAYPLTPALVVDRFIRLGYRKRYVMYVGMSHPQSFVWDAGLVRDGETGGWVIDPDLPPVNTPTRRWFEDFAARLAAIDVELWISVSFEILNSICPPGWRQLDADGNPALTGWDPPSSLVSVVHPEALDYLADLATDFIRICLRQGCRVGYQIGEPWHWISAFEPGKPAFLLPPEQWVPFIYDPFLVAAWTAATGLPVPTPLVRTVQVSDAVFAANAAYFAFCRRMLGEATRILVQKVKGAFLPDAGIKTAILIFTPQVLDSRTNVAPAINLPLADQWGADVFDVLMIEDYDWTILGLRDEMRRTWEVAKDLGFPLDRTIYFAGFVLLAEDAAEQWPHIGYAVDDALKRGALQVMPWSREQVWRDGWVYIADGTFGIGADIDPRFGHRGSVALFGELPLSLDFAAKRLRRAGAPVVAGDVVTIERDSYGAFVEIDGRPREVSPDVPRIASGIGLVIDPDRENEIANASLVGAAVGVVGSGGQLPDGWHVTDDMTEVEVLAIGEMPGSDSRWRTITVRLTCDNTGGGSQLSPRLRFAPSNGIPAGPGEPWAGSVFAQVLASTALKNRLALLPRNAGGSAIVTTYATLPTLFGRVGAAAITPDGTVKVETAIQLTVPAGTEAVVDLVLACPVLEHGAGVSSPIRRSPGEMVPGANTLSGTIAGVRAAEDAALVAPVLSGTHGVLTIEAEERGAIGDGVMASFVWGDWRLLVHGGADPGVTITRGAATIREERRLPVIPTAIVRFAVAWSAGRLIVAFNSALDGLTVDLADQRFQPAAAPVVRLGSDADGGRDALTAVRIVSGGPWRADVAMTRGMASDPGTPVVPSPWRLYRHAWACPPLGDAPALPYWTPITYDTSDTSIGWNGPPPDPMPDEQTVPPDLIVPSMYGPRDPDNPGRDILHVPSYEAFLSIVTPIRDFQKVFVKATDDYRQSGVPAVAFAMAGGMLQAAEAGVLTGVRNDTGTAQIERWLGCAGSAWLKICRAGFGTPEERAIVEAHFRDLAEQLIEFQLLKRATGSSYAINNHYFWASWGIAVVGLILGDRAMIEWGHECLEFAIDASADAGAIVAELDPDGGDGEGFPGGDDDPDPETENVEGTQPAESVRLTRALHYHNFAMPPLMALAEIAIADGRDPYGRRAGQLHKMVEFVGDALDNPALMTAVQEAVLGEGNGAVQDTSMWTGPEGIVAHQLPNGSQMSWAWIYCRRFPGSDFARKWAPRLVEVYSSLRSSNLGGDMRILYPWRHPVTTPLVVDGAPYQVAFNNGPVLTGTATPGATVTVVGAGADRVVTVGVDGGWSVDLGDIGVAEWGLTAYQTTALGVHPRVAFGVSVQPYQAETLAILARWTALGTPATEERADDLDLFIKDLKDFGLWAKFDALYFVQHSVDASRVNWKNPAGPLLSLTNAPTIVPDRCFAGDGIASYFDTGFNPATAGGGFRQDDAAAFVYSLTDLNAANSFDIGSGVTNRIAGRFSGAMTARANSGTTTTHAVGDSKGLYGWRRNNSGSMSFFRGAAVVETVAAASSAPSSSNIRIGSAGSAWSPRKIAAAGFGPALSDGDIYNLNYFIEPWLQKIGALPGGGIMLAETAALVNRWAELGSPVSLARALWLDEKIIRPLVNNLLWGAKITHLFAPAWCDTHIQARVNWINPSAEPLIERNSPIFQPVAAAPASAAPGYFMTDGVASHHSPGVNDYSAIFAAGSVHMGAWCLNNSIDNGREIGLTSSGSIRLIVRNPGGKSNSRIFSTGGFLQASATSVGHSVITNDPANATTGQRFIRDGVTVGSAAGLAGTTVSTLQFGRGLTNYSLKHRAIMHIGYNVTDVECAMLTSIFGAALSEAPPA